MSVLSSDILRSTTVPVSTQYLVMSVLLTHQKGDAYRGHKKVYRIYCVGYIFAGVLI